MRKRKTKKKSFVISMALAAGLLVPMAMNAQNDGSRGLFGRGFDASESTRDGSGMEWQGGGMTAQDPTQEAPLGSGLVLLMAAGAGYAVLKSKSGKEELR
jgi:hypothetical protein